MNIELSCNGTIISVEAITNTIQIVNVLYNKLIYAEDSARFSARFTVELSDFLKQNINEDIKCVFSDNNESLFTGFIRKNIAFQKTQINQPISLEVISPSFTFDKTSNKGKAYINKTLAFIIQDLLDEAGFTFGGDFSPLQDEISVLIVNEGDNYKSVIIELLYEYGFVFNFNKNGQIIFYKLFNIPEVEDIRIHFDGNNLKNNIKITATNQEGDCVKVKYGSVKLHNNILIFEDTSGATSTKKCEVAVEGNSWYGGEQFLYLNCDSEEGEVIYIESVVGNIVCEEGITYQYSKFDLNPENNNKDLGNQICFSAKNTVNYSRKFFRIDFTANAFCRKGDEYECKSFGKKNTIEKDLIYIVEKEKALNFVSNYTNWLRYANNVINVSLLEDYTIGEYVTVTDTGIGTYNGRIIQKTKLYNTALFSYVVETFTEYEPTIIENKATQSDLILSKIHGTLINAEGYTDEQIAAQKDTTPPTVPTLVSATSNDLGNIQLVWTRSTDEQSGMASYQIYRRKNTESIFQKVNTVPEPTEQSEQITYTDIITDKNVTYVYRISAMDKAYNESAKSNELTVDSVVTVAPNAPSTIIAKAEKDGIVMEWSEVRSTDPLYNASSYILEVSRDNGTTWGSIEVSATSYTYLFNRQTVGYPEADVFENWKIKISSKSIYGNVSETATSVSIIDINSYGTWIVPTPVITTRVNGRGITLIMETGTSQRTVYGNITHRIEIQRGMEGDVPTEWFKPNLISDPYSSEENYKNGLGYVISNDIFQQVLPLMGQNTMQYDESTTPPTELGYLPVDTTYRYRIICQNEAHEQGSPSIVTIIALCTSAHDLAVSTITNNKLQEGCVTFDKIHAGVLSAESVASYGMVADNAIIGKIQSGQIEKNSVWDLNSGEFRVGNDTQYEAKKEGSLVGNPDISVDNELAEYLHVIPNQGIFMKIKNFIITSISSLIKGLFYVKGNEDTKDSLLIANANQSKDTSTQVSGRTVKINGGFKVKSDKTINDFISEFSLPESIQINFITPNTLASRQTEEGE